MWVLGRESWGACKLAWGREEREGGRRSGREGGGPPGQRELGRGGTAASYGVGTEYHLIISHRGMGGAGRVLVGRRGMQGREEGFEERSSNHRAAGRIAQNEEDFAPET